MCDFRLAYGRVLSRRSRVIAINRCQQQLYKVHSRQFLISRRYDMAYPVTLSVCPSVT